MPTKAEKYRFREGVTKLNSKELNNRVLDIDSRIAALEATKAEYEAAIAKLENTGLERINETLDPLVQEAQNTLTEAAGLVEGFTTLPDDVAEFLGWTNQVDPEGDGYFYPPTQRSGNATLQYNMDGTVSQIDYTVPQGMYSLIYGYTAEGLVDTITAELDGVELWTRTYQYDGEGRVESWTETVPE